MSNSWNTSHTPTKGKGKYIVFEGIQGSGKTEQIQRIAQFLQSRGITVHVTREPGGTDMVARAIRLLTQDPEYELSTKTEVLLYNAARSQSLEKIRLILERGMWVVCDRNYLTTLAIQYHARHDGLAYDDIMTVTKFAVGDMEPDLVLLLDLDPTISIKRLSQRTNKDRFDMTSTEFLERMRQGYLDEAAKRSNVMVVDSTRELSEVTKELQQVVEHTLL